MDFIKNAVNQGLYMIHIKKRLIYGILRILSDEKRRICVVFSPVTYNHQKSLVMNSLQPICLLSYLIEYDRISSVRLEQRRDSLVIAFPETERRYIWTR